jgi:hypothetical protein
MLLKQPPTFFLQETHNFYSKTSTRPTYDVSCKGCSHRHQRQGVQKVCPMRTSSCTLHAKKGSCKSDQSLKTTIGVDGELRLSIWHCKTRKVFLMNVSSALDAIKKWGTFKTNKKAHEAYVEQWEAAKQAKATLALFMAPTSKGKKASKKLPRKLLRRLPRKLLGRTALRKKRLLRRPRKAQFCPMHQPQNFAMSTRPSTTRPFL